MSNNNQKKELAIILPVSGNMAYALAVTLMGIKKHLTITPYDIFVYYQNVSDKEKELLNSIAPCEFREYSLDASTVKSDAINKYSELTFARFECFEHLKEYKKALWIDIDTLIQKDLIELVDIDAEFAAWQTDVWTGFNFTEPIDGYDMKIKYYNVGIMMVSDKIKEPEKIKKWCYEKTIELGDKLICSDQSILNIAFQEFNINVYNLDETYNCHPDKEFVNDAVIVHPYAQYKFWNYYYNFNQWNTYYQKWLDMGGSAYKGWKANWFDKLRIKLRKKYWPEAPNPKRHLGKFIRYVYNYNFKKRAIKELFKNV